MKRRRTDSGASAVEFALVLVPLITLLFALIQYALYFWAMQGGSDVARSAARLSAVSDPADCATFTTDVLGQIGSFGTDEGATVTRTYDRQAAGTVTIGDTVTVTVRFKSVDLHFPFIPFIKDGWVTQTAESRVDYVPAQPEECS